MNMNRINELFTESGCGSPPTVGDPAIFTTEDIECFSKAIVDACLSTLELNGYDDAMGVIKDYFGVQR